MTDKLIHSEKGARRTGKTFRTVLHALAMASAGNKVVHMSADKRQSLHAFDWAKSIVRGYEQTATMVSQHSKAIEFENGGRVDFKDPDQRTEGLKFDRGVIDDLTWAATDTANRVTRMVR